MKKVLLTSALAATLAFGGAACGGSSDSTAGGGDGGDSGGGGKISLVAYSTPAEAYADITDAFAQTPAGEGVSFSESYGSSGDQSRAVEGGLAADVVHFALEPDIQRLVDAGTVDASWQDGPTNGIAADSLTVFMVREGNPKNIDSWDDLARDDVEVINPNPFTSGGARWNVMAAYGSQLEQGKSEKEATQFLFDLYRNVSVQDDSARDSLQTFTGGKGDVLLGYENEAILAQEKGAPIEYIVPDQTILIETPIAVTSNAKNPKAAQAFVDYVLSPDAQRIFGENGYRPVDRSVAGEFDYEQPADLFTIEDVGGWPEVMTKFFDSENGIMAEVQRSIGAPTDG